MNGIFMNEVYVMFTAIASTEKLTKRKTNAFFTCIEFQASLQIS